MVFFYLILLLSVLLLVFLGYGSISRLNQKILVNKLFLASFFLFIAIIIFQFLAGNYKYSLNPLMSVKNASFSYTKCITNRLLEDECDVKKTELEAAKADAELQEKALTAISAAVKLGENLALSKKITPSPYDLVTRSLTRYPLFIFPTKENYLLYKDCNSVSQPLYVILGWHIYHQYNYILIGKLFSCDRISRNDISEDFSVITEDQYLKLKDGIYWQRNRYSSFPTVIFVNNLLTTIDEVDKRLDKDRNDKINEEKKNLTEENQ